MQKGLLVLVFVPLFASAQVNLCVDSKGRKTYTEAECDELGMQSVGVLKDIKPKKKHCYELEGQIANSRAQAERMRKVGGPANYGEAMAVIQDGNTSRLEADYKKECKR
ncbi:MAG: hypothetical protein ACTHKB_13790 [Burkholderiaceae bacterium]